MHDAPRSVKGREYAPTDRLDLTPAGRDALAAALPPFPREGDNFTTVEPHRAVRPLSAAEIQRILANGRRQNGGRQ